MDALVAAVKLLDAPAVEGPRSIEDLVESVEARWPFETRLARL